MVFIKRASIVILVTIVVGLLFREWLYRRLVTYKTIGPRANYSATNDKLIAYLNANIDKEDSLGVEEIIRLGLSITSEKLNFTADKNEVDPNRLVSTKTAHCVGYASFFATTCNYLLAEKNLADTWTAKPQAGQIYFLGTNVHTYFNSSFFKDHDFVTIENRVTGQVLAVDPTLNDYLRIDLIAIANKKQSE